MRRKAVPLGNVAPGVEFFWTPNQCFGGYVIKHLKDDLTLMNDSGSDGNHFAERLERARTIVYVEHGIHFWIVRASNWHSRPHRKLCGVFFSYLKAQAKAKKLKTTNKYDFVFIDKYKIF